MNTKKTISKKAKTVAAKKVTKTSAKTSTKKSNTTTTKKTTTKHKPVVKKVTTKKVIKKAKAIPALKKIVEAKKTSHPRESRVKRVTYMTLSVLLGLLLGTFVSLFVELVYMRKAVSVGASLQTHYFLGLASYLPFFAQQIFLLAGLIFGVWLGFWGWKLVYIERRHRMYRK